MTQEGSKAWVSEPRVARPRAPRRRSTPAAPSTPAAAGIAFEGQWAEVTLRKLSSAAEETADGQFITDRNGVIKYVTPAFAALMGFSPDEVVGQTPRLFKSGEHNQKFYQQVWSTLLSGQAFRGVFLDRKKNGDLIYLDESITPLRDTDGNIINFVTAVRDVTQYIQTEETLHRLNESLEQQAKRIAQALHDEAGQLLTCAHIALAEAIPGLPPAAVERLNEVRRHLDGIEEQLRRLAHEFRPRILEDLGLVPALEFLAQGVEKRHGISVAVEAALQSRLPAVVETRLYRLVNETLTNVSKHARATHVTVRLEQAPRTLRCTIEDDGVGFDAPAVSVRLGERGLGLIGIREQLEALGGTFQINSALSRGTQLTITIPLEK